MTSLSCVDFKFLTFRLEVHARCFVPSALISFKTKDASKIFKVQINSATRAELINRTCSGNKPLLTFFGTREALTRGTNALCY